MWLQYADMPEAEMPVVKLMVTVCAVVWHTSELGDAKTHSDLGVSKRLFEPPAQTAFFASFFYL